MTQPTAQLLALADFNEARLNEDETAARACAGNGEWSADDIAIYGADLAPEVRDHMARHDPARALREVAAKRLLIDNWKDLIQRIDTEPDPEKRERLALTRHGLDQVAFQFAAVHSMHPDYQPGWRP